MVYNYLYKCDTCFATKEIVFDTERVGRMPDSNDLPDSLICGYRGCEGVALNVYNEDKK